MLPRAVDASVPNKQWRLTFWGLFVLSRRNAHKAEFTTTFGARGRFFTKLELVHTTSASVSHSFWEKELKSVATREAGSVTAAQYNRITDMITGVMQVHPGDTNALFSRLNAR